MEEEKQASRDPSRKLLLTIVILLAVIAVGVILILVIPRGRIPVTIESFTPEGRVPQTTNFTVEFSQEIVPETLINVPLEKAPLVFNPSIPGEFKWIARHKLRFFSEAYLLPSSNYTAHVLPEVIVREGQFLKGKRKFRFYTTRFRVDYASVSLVFGPDIKKQVILQGEVAFNYPVDPKDVKKYMSLRYGRHPTIPYEITTQEADKKIRFETEPMARWEEDRTVVLKVVQWLKPIKGNLGLSEDYVRDIRVKGKGELKVEGLIPDQKGRFGTLKIKFSAPVAADEAEQYITVEPSIDVKMVSDYRYIKLLGSFEAGIGYTVTVKPGMMATDGSILKREFSDRVALKNLEPRMEFVGKGIYLSREGNLNVGLETVNMDSVEVEVVKIYANNLVYLLHTGTLRYDRGRRYGYNVRNLGKMVSREKIAIATVLNEEVITPINLQKYLDDERIGIFSVGAYKPGERWKSSHRWAMITDLGIMAKMTEDQLVVWVNSLSTLKPVRGAKVTLISRNNQTLLEGFTDSNGLAKFSATREAIGDFDPFFIVASHEKDLSFIELSRNRLSFSDFEVGGNPYLLDGYTAFLYTDRGVYRPGENAHLVSIVREPEMIVPASFPLRVEVWGPQDQMLYEFRKETNEQGGCEFEVHLPSYIRTGRYTAKAFLGKKNEIGRTSFGVEEFMPDRIKVKMETDSAAYSIGQRVPVRVEAVNLFGPPAAGRRSEVKYVIEQMSFSAAEWKHFTFRDGNKKFDKQSRDAGSARLDENGRRTFYISLPEGLSPPSGLKCILTATVFEPGGRSVTARHGFDVHAYSHYAGLRRLKEGYLELDEPVELEFIILDKNKQVAPGRECEVSFYQIVYQNVLRRTGRRGYRYVSERQEKLVESFRLTSKKQAERFTVTPDDYGRYRAEIRDKNSNSSSSMTFYVSGWGYAPWAMEKPERLELDLDKPSYRPGETAKVQIRAPFSGKLILTVEKEKVVDHRVLMMEENTATLEIPVSSDYKPNVYLSASVIRSTSSLEQHAPVRAYGAVPLLVDCGDNRHTLNIDVPTEVRPERPLKIDFTVEGKRKSHYITIAAVDEGILQLTNFQTPDAFDFFFSKKRLAVESYDLYSAILPEVEKATTPKSPSGGLAEEERRKRLIPIAVKRVKPVALWSGLLKTDSRGRGSVSLDVPQFNGTLRVMVLSFSGEQFGSARKNVIVREPIVLTPTYPRFISSDDEFLIPVSVFNGTGRKDRFTVTLNVEGPVEELKVSSQTLSLKPEEEGQIVYSVKALRGMGKVTFTLTAEGGHEKAKVTTELPLRPPSPPITLTGSGMVKAGEKGSFAFPSNWISGTTQFDLSLSPFPMLEFAGGLQYLLRYPHGCAEQTTSKVFPLLYFNDLARLVEPELFGTKGPDYFIGEGIRKLENMQLSDGWFTFWPRGWTRSAWTSIYVVHFLVEARKAGYEVSDRVYDRMISALERNVRTRIRDRWELGRRAYACYVLAAAGKPNRSAMLFLKNNELHNMGDYSQYHLAGAFALSGDLKTASTLLPSTVDPGEVKRESGRNFNSSTRAAAIMLDILAEVDPDNPAVLRLVKTLSDRASKRNRWYTTQENAFAFLALGKIFRKQEPGHYTGKITISGNPYADFDSRDQRFTAKDWGGKRVSLQVKGSGNCYYYWKAFGISQDPDIPEYDEELEVRRTYLTKTGHPIEDMVFKQGDLIVGLIACKALTENLDHVIITDLLPAGFEIENPRLESRAGIEWIGRRDYRSDYMDMRDDRLLISVSLPRQRERKFYYAIRAVTRGKFILPPIAAEAMYDPAKSSVSGTGKIQVVE